MQWFNHVIRFARDNVLIFVIALFAIITLWLSATHFKQETQTILNGFFLVLSSVLAVVLAIRNYHFEQRTARLQSIYFEDTLLGQAKVFEGIMSQTNHNVSLTQNALHFAHLLLQQSDVAVDFNLLKEEMDDHLQSTMQAIELNIGTTDFKKQTLLNLMADSAEDSQFLPDWIKKIEQDAYAFLAFLRSLVCTAKLALQQKNVTVGSFVALLKVLSARLEKNYLLIKRHYIFLNLYSRLVLDFCSENYASQEKILLAFKKDHIKRLFRLLGRAYRDLIQAFAHEKIDALSDEAATNLSAKIRWVEKRNLRVLG